MKNIRDSYKLYKRDCKKPIEIDQYLDIVHSFLKFIMNEVYNGEKVALPQRLGTINVIGKKIKAGIDKETGQIKNLAPDWVRTKELWENCPECKENKQLVFHLNEHTNGVRYRINWSKKNVLVKNKTMYSLIFTRDNKRALHKLIINGKEYLVN